MNSHGIQDIAFALPVFIYSDWDDWISITSLTHWWYSWIPSVSFQLVPWRSYRNSQLRWETNLIFMRKHKKTKVDNKTWNMWKTILCLVETETQLFHAKLSHHGGPSISLSWWEDGWSQIQDSPGRNPIGGCRRLETGWRFTFQQDNSPKHTARDTMIIAFSCVRVAWSKAGP